jgi:SAM-dependent methyltransferase
LNLASAWRCDSCQVDLLLTLARQVQDFVGWGIDANPAMLRLARARAKADGLQTRVRFIRDDARNLKAIPADIRTQVGSVLACNIANEMFSDGDATAVRWLKNLRRLFPGRPLLIQDYYGLLGQKKTREILRERETLLHDFVQLISGQGIPPATARHWQAIYKKAGSTLVHITEDTSTTRFIHILRL